MSTLAALKSCKTLDDVAAMLGYKPSALSYLIYVLPSSIKYNVFTIPKKSGGDRTIKAPESRLKTLQKHLANMFYAVVLEQKKLEDPPLRSLSHGFKKNHSIYTNAQVHKGKRFVLNLDLEDFFPSINFGRVRGFLIKNDDFQLPQKVATILAQIACHDNELPQGSPCSPIISDLIAHILDVRLAQLAKKYRCSYSRYADDLTFSTNQKNFPAELAVNSAPDVWDLSDGLLGAIKRSGFRVNSKKTRMQIASNRQVVTGLSVNRKVNVHAAYYRYARSMCRSLFRVGTYHRPGDGALPPPQPEVLEKIDTIEGILNFIHYIKDRSDNRDGQEKKAIPISARVLYRQLLNYKNFVALEKPLVICEGKTDNTYLECAIKYRPQYQASLTRTSGGKTEKILKLFNYSEISKDVMFLGGGYGDLHGLIEVYEKKIIEKYQHKPLRHPVIIVIDNDDGAKSIFGLVRGKYKVQIDHKPTADFYHLIGNLYLVKTPELGATGVSCSEDLFDKSVLATQISGKTFNATNKENGPNEYGKHIFAEQVVRKNAATINFSAFDGLLHRIEAVIKSYVPPP